MALTGVWLNELKSIMVLKENPDGSLSGKYRSIVGRDPHTRDLAGRTSPEEQGKQMLGFAVCFKIDNPASGYGHHSVCGWSGWARDGKTITTHWLLTVSVIKKEDEWSSTLLGEDTFTKVTDTADEELLTAELDILEKLLQKATAELVSR